MQNLKLSEKKVLLVEDNKEHQILFEAMAPIIWIENYDLAENWKEAVEMASQQLYDIILMDIRMPEMDGSDATKQIRELENWIHPKIIAYTAVDCADLSYDFDWKILKPADSKYIRNAILEVLSK